MSISGPLSTWRRRHVSRVIAALVGIALLSPSAPLASAGGGGPNWAKAFAPSTITAGDQSRLTFTINWGTSSGTVSNIQFTDELPAGIVVASSPNPTNTCEGTLGANPGESTITFSGGSVNGSRPSCSVAVDVVASTPDTYVNLTSTLTFDPQQSTLDPVTATLEVEGPTCTISSSDRVILGTPGDDVICVNGDGLHVVSALDGHDIVLGGPGIEIVFGGPGDDTISGGDGSDLLLGQTGDDEMLGDGGVDIAIGGPGSDVCAVEFQVFCSPPD